MKYRNRKIRYLSEIQSFQISSQLSIVCTSSVIRLNIAGTSLVSQREINCVPDATQVIVRSRYKSD